MKARRIGWRSVIATHPVSVTWTNHRGTLAIATALTSIDISGTDRNRRQWPVRSEGLARERANVESGGETSRAGYGIGSLPAVDLKPPLSVIRGHLK
jgi:hypothetical protein